MPRFEAGAPMTVDWGKEQVEVSTIDRELPPASLVDDRNKLVKAGLNSPLASLPEDAWHAIARAAVTPETVALQLRESQDAHTSLLLEEHVDGATLRSVHTRVWLSELFPAIQPRMGQELLAVDDPQVQGVAENGRPQAILRYRYDTPEHLKRHVQQTIAATLYRNSYAESILARRVTRALIVHPVVYEFADGTDPVCVLIARDGITRLASAWKVLAGADSEPEAVAALAADTLFAQHRPTASEPAKPLTQRMALARENRRKRLREEFAREMAGSTAAGEAPSLRAVQIAQSHVVPAYIAVGAEAHERASLSTEDVFDDALRSVLASVHVEFKPWDTAAQNVEVASRALKHVLQGASDSGVQAVYDLAVGRRTPAETPQVYGDEHIPGTGLWRAVLLLHTLTRPAVSEGLRNRAKEIKGDRRMTDKGYAGLLGPIVDHPWRSTKKSAAQQARNAWTNGGVLFKEVQEDGWVPVVTDDFTTLVEPALDGSRDARLTLALAGGTALIADKLLTRNVGSAVSRTRAPGKVPFRSDVHKVVEGLAREGNALGLWTLALAAQRFEDGGLPRNSGWKQLGLPSGRNDQASTGYEHYAVDVDAPDRMRRDDDGGPVPLLEWDVVVASDEVRARQVLGPAAFGEDEPEAGNAHGYGPEAAGGGRRPGAGAPDGTASLGAAPTPDDAEDFLDAPDGERSVEQRIPEARHRLTTHLSSAKTYLDELEKLGQAVSFPPVLGPAERWRDLYDTAGRIFASLQNRADDYADDGAETD
ncbi:hypothetical protein [Streptomyces sp. TRM64462]|uniref:hypothetical protein n=1 Tax=Streptomyces sp. TRM64462 TaxID=2741726 RepID=UPI0015861805|nr:hypothetical protein [Streptomyces sp. TRM64462]